MNNFCLLTNDVETMSIVNNRLDDNIANLVWKEGLPRLLDLYNNFGVQSTFFFTGHIAKLNPKLVKIVHNNGHEVGSHGLSHEPNKSFDILPLQDQINHLKISKDILENVTGDSIISFRAPALRVNNNTAIALQETGFKIDSSISSQRFDFFLTFGNVNKMKWLTAPRKPYFTKSNNLFQKGNGSIFEIPISAFFVAYIGTTMRIFPTLIKLLRFILHLESNCTKKPIVFLIHPHEFINEIVINRKINKRATNYLSYILGDIVRRKLKIKNLGDKTIPIYESQLKFLKKRNYAFCTLKDYCIKTGLLK